MWLRKTTSHTQCNSPGVCVFCTSDLCFHWEILGVYTPTDAESLGVTPPTTGCSPLKG